MLVSVHRSKRLRPHQQAPPPPPTTQDGSYRLIIPYPSHPNLYPAVEPDTASSKERGFFNPLSVIFHPLPYVFWAVVLTVLWKLLKGALKFATKVLQNKRSGPSQHVEQCAGYDHPHTR